jgi:hypothetical protein
VAGQRGHDHAPARQARLSRHLAEGEHTQAGTSSTSVVPTNAASVALTRDELTMNST